MPHRRACDLSPENRADLLRQSDLAGGLSEPLLTRLAENSTAIDYRRRRFIYRANDVADSLYVIARGRVKLCRVEEVTGREAVIDILPVGSLFGESALYSASGAREDCAVAYETSRLLRIPVGEFQRGMAEKREFYDYIFRLTGQRLAHAERRVAETDGVLIDLPLPHREIASIVGSTRESVTVRLNVMRREGIIDFVNRKILIKRPESLATI